MADAPHITPRDLYVGCFCSIHGWGGALTTAQDILVAAQRRGLSTLLLGATATGDAPESLRPDVSEYDVSVPMEPFLWRLRGWRLAGQLARRIRHLPPPRRAFVAHSPYWAVAAKRAWPATRVVFFAPCILRRCLPFTWPNRRSPSWWAGLDYRGTCRTEWRALTRSDLVLTYTDCQRAEVIAEYGAVADRVRAFRTAVPPERRRAVPAPTERARLGLPNDAFVLVGVGVLDRNKAYDFAVQALPAMDSRVHLVVVGEGPQRRSIERLAQELSVAERVHLAGGQRDMSRWYAACDCVVSTSFYEAFGLTLLEGMHFGRPVLVPRHDPPQVYAGFAEMVTASGGGLLYDRLRPEALAACVNRLARDRELYDRLSREALQCAQRAVDREADLDLILGEAAHVAAARTPLMPVPAD